MIDQLIATYARKGGEKEKAGHIDAAFSFYESANTLKFKGLQWDDAIEDELCAAIIATFTADYIERHRLRVKASITPVFIVGMPRSGSTLIEQILDSHSLIHGAGEVPYLAAAIVDEFAESSIYPEDLADQGRIALWHMRNDYLEKLSYGHREKPFVCDKLLVNFMHIGLIAILFPNAKIIHAARNRDDCLWSCYTKQFNKENLPYTYDRNALTAYYARYQAMMVHWEQVLPGRIHTVHYESMVREHEATVRDLLRAVGVQFEAGCLDFHQNKREVKTASRDQVNKPIYTSSIGRGGEFKKYFSL